MTGKRRRIDRAEVLSKNIPKTYCFTERDLHLFELPQIFSACSLWLESGMASSLATFDLVVREMPPNRNFLLMGGTEEIIQGISNWGYTKDEIHYLAKNKIITPNLAEHLEGIHFTGSLYALPEGTIFFPGEPVLRITAPLVEGNLLTMFLINAFVSNTVPLSKAVRGVIAAKDKKFLSSASLRAQSSESAFKYGRAVYLSGGHGSTMIPSFCRKYHLPFLDASRKLYHMVVQSFPTEIDSMRKITSVFPSTMDFMVDTYDFEKGIKNAILVATELRKKGNSIRGITIDSGDLYKRSVRARKLLDKAGLKDISITVASNLDEKKIDALSDRNAPIDQFLAITEMISSRDAPSLEAVYKLAELQRGSALIPKAKLIFGKVSYPGKKQVFRVYKKGKMRKDVVGMSDERLGRPLLKKLIEKGTRVYTLPSLEKIRASVGDQLKKLPPRLLSIKKQYAYRVEISRGLRKLMRQVRKAHQ
ncbi:MAG: nicotinate phosphoribosyltransferase [Nanoarchaeota archaeon]|nr:nicotinate phosphoribosyltransferase [Nanoarchaeota archaeon]